MNDDAAPRIGARIQMTRLAPTFQALAQFGSTESYKLLPFRFLNLNDGRVVLTNLAGQHLVSSRDTLEKLVARAPIDDTELRDLEGGHFISRGDLALHGELLAAQIRTKQSRLSDFTSLHMFVVTLRCDHSCAYCQVSRVSDDKTAFDMSPETADRAVDLMLASPSPQLKVEFQGGESLLNFPIVERIVKRVKEKATDRETAFVAATNLSFLTDEMLSFFKEHGVSISTSLDGPEGLHNSNRPRPGKDSYQRTIDGIERCRRVLGHDAVSALMTCTVASLSAPEAIIDEYVAKGFREVFLRHVSPYGFAVRAGSKVRYETERFLDFYRRGLEHVLKLNREGVVFRELYTTLLLRRMLSSFPTRYVDLQSPMGAGLSALLYNYDGDVYASDEGRMLAEMGDKRYRLGNVHENTWRELYLESDVLDLAHRTMNEGLVGCSECAFQPWCGSDPVFHHATQGDEMGHRPTSSFCRRNMEVMRHLVTLLEDRPDDARILRRWAQ